METPASMTTPIRDMTFIVVPVSTKVSRTPMMPGGNASRMISGYIYRPELRHKNQVQENNGEDQPDAETAERGVHGFRASVHGELSRSQERAMA